VDHDLGHWTSARPPERSAIQGATVTLDPLDPTRHGASLYAAGSSPLLWEYLPYGPFGSELEFTTWLAQRALSTDPLFFAVIDRGEDRAQGMASYQRIVPAHGVIEIAHIWFSPALQNTRQSTEALFLLAGQAFDQRGYRRLEWKCDARNGPSRAAAERLGFKFEGIFRQHMVVKGRNRDSAWFAMLDRDWPTIRRAFAAWLAPSNFDRDGNQRRSLAAVRDEISSLRADSTP
jgi:RimJ/RimL family protein N-acetyltransferase